MGCLVDYLRTHRDVAAAAIDDVQAGGSLPHEHQVWRGLAEQYELSPFTRAWHLGLSDVVPGVDFDRTPWERLPISEVVREGLD